MPLRFILQFLLIFTLFGGLSVYLWTRLARRPAWPRPWPRIVTALFWLLTGATPLIVMGVRFGAPVEPLRLPAFLWMGWLFFMLWFFIDTDLIWALARFINRRRHRRAAPDLSRRRTIARLLAGGGGVISAGLVGAGFRQSQADPTVERVTVRLKRLPTALNGLTIAQLSDIHVGQLIGAPEVQAMVRQVNALDPDLVAITGDLADGTPARLGAAVAPLGRLRSRYGVFFVTGNHDYYSGAEPWVAHLRRLGLRVLRNERVSIGRSAESFDLAGVEDPTGGSFGRAPDLRRALRDRDARRELVLLAHRPRQIYEAEELGVGLQLSGHTHGGQFMPLSFLAPIVFPYVTGLHRRGATQIYVNRGTGTVGVPLRLGVPAEITLLELRRG